ncbi:unnamed protein product [Discosporangium mesarthrocarpum]
MIAHRQLLLFVLVLTHRGTRKGGGFLLNNLVGRSVKLSSSNGSIMPVSSASHEGGTGRIVLGSKSFTRKMIIEEMGFKPLIRTADIDEKAIGDRAADPRDLVLELGLAKAAALLPTLRLQAEKDELDGARLLLTGDQVVVHEGRILEKPANFEEVRRNIAAYAKSPCHTVGSAVLTDLVTGRQESGVDTAEIFFAEIPDDVVTKLCEEGMVLQCAGGLMVEHELVQPYLKEIQGTIDSVMGLSKPLVLRLLARMNGSPSGSQGL